MTLEAILEEDEARCDYCRGVLEDNDRIVQLDVFEIEFEGKMYTSHHIGGVSPVVHIDCLSDEYRPEAGE